MIISSVGSIKPVVTPTTVDGTGGTGAAGPAKGSTNTFVAGLENVQASLDNADTLAKQLASGELTDVHTYMAAATKAELAVQMTVAIRDRAVEAYQEIMRMQV